MGSSCSRHGAQGPGETAEKPYSRGLKTVKGTQAERRGGTRRTWPWARGGGAGAGRDRKDLLLQASSQTR